MRYMLDTNICIYLIQRQPKHVLAHFATLSVGEAVMSAITLAELRHGVERHLACKVQADQALKRLVELVPAIPFEDEAAIRYGILTAAVQERKRNVLDRLIAAHAYSVNCVLVTNNEADFIQYKNLKIENWVNFPTDNC